MRRTRSCRHSAAPFTAFMMQVRDRSARPLHAGLPIMLASLKQTAYRMSNGAGLVARVGLDAWRRSRLLILCYHGVSAHDEHEWDPLLYVSTATFERRLALIRRHGCTVLSLDDAVRRLYARDLPARSVVFTFDDGYHDFRLRAWPALQRYSFPATVYLTTQRCASPASRLNGIRCTRPSSVKLCLGSSAGPC
jgi:hypothetical protein